MGREQTIRALVNGFHLSRSQNLMQLGEAIWAAARQEARAEALREAYTEAAAKVRDEKLSWRNEYVHTCLESAASRIEQAMALTTPTEPCSGTEAEEDESA